MNFKKLSLAMLLVLAGVMSGVAQADDAKSLSHIDYIEKMSPEAKNAMRQLVLEKIKNTPHKRDDIGSTEYRLDGDVFVIVKSVTNPKMQRDLNNPHMMIVMKDLLKQRFAEKNPFCAKNPADLRVMQALNIRQARLIARNGSQTFLDERGDIELCR